MWTFFLNPQTSQNLQKSTLLIKSSSKWPEKKISYISPLPIYKKIFISGSNSKIFTNKVGFRPPGRVSKTSAFQACRSPYLVKMLQMGPNPNGMKHITIGGYTRILEFTSKFRIRGGPPTPIRVPPGEKYCGWSTPPMSQSTHPSLVKIRDFALWMFLCGVHGRSVNSE